MLDRQRLIQHGQGVALLFAGLFLALSLAGYHLADAPSSAAFPTNDPPANPCGPVGALLAFGLTQAVGWAAWLVLAVWMFVAWSVFRQRFVPDAKARIIGAALLVVVAAATLQTTLPSGVEADRARVEGEDSPSDQALAQWFGVQYPPVGAGGYLGAATLAFLRGNFGPIGMALILLAVGLYGVILCHERFVSSLLRRLTPRRAEPSSIPAVPGTGLALTHPRLAEHPEQHRARFDPEDRAQPDTTLRTHLPLPSLTAAATMGSSSMKAPPTVPARSLSTYQLPPLELLEPPSALPVQEHESRIQERAMLLEKTLLEHGCQVRVVQIDTGPVITQFEIELEAGLRVSKIVGLANDLAIALAVPSVRIVAPIPGKTTVGIEVPNERRTIVRLREVLEGVRQQLSKCHIPLFLGKDVKGNPLVFDLADMPHLLIGGRTGTGKSVCLNAMILSILMTRRPDEVKLILVDPKMVELSQYKQIPHLMHPVVTDMKKAESLLNWACDKMDERYTFLARAGVRSLHSYNALGADEIYNRLRPEDEEERQRIPTYMPHIVIIVDEMNDMMMTAAKEVEAHIVRLAQKARAVGMHLIVATQKPTVDVITGLIKGNLPARIAFQVSSRGDSRVILDEMGAEKLLGNGDMLFLIPGTSHLVRAQGTYVSDAEVERSCGHLAQYPVEFSKELMQMRVGSGIDGKDRGAALKERDELYEPAIDIIVREGRGSCSLLQRALGIGYGRAARLIDYMAEDGIVGEYKSGAAREVLYTWEEWEAMKNGEAA